MSISQANHAGNGSINPALVGNPTLGLSINKASFMPNPTGYVHEHNHRMTPHMHSPPCDRFVSGVDKNRQSRFYFTKMPTPIRVYLNYSEKLAPAPSAVIDPNTLNMVNTNQQTSEQINPLLNGRKLSPKTLRSQLKLSPHFIDDAKNYIFNKDTLSLVPILPTINTNIANAPHMLTMAEMATQPLNLPPITQQPHHAKTKLANNAAARQTASIKSRKLTETSVKSSMANMGNIDNRLEDFINEE